MSTNEVSIFYGRAVIYELDVAENEWRGKCGEEWADVYIFHEPVGVPGHFRMVGWIPGTRAIVLNQDLTDESVWCSLADDYVQFTDPHYAPMGLCFEDEAAAEQMREVMEEIMGRLGADLRYAFVDLAATYSIPQGVEEWLKDLGLQQYGKVFLKNKFDTAPSLLSLNAEILKNMKVKKPHRETILTAISNLTGFVLEDEDEFLDEEDEEECEYEDEDEPERGQRHERGSENGGGGGGQRDKDATWRKDIAQVPPSQLNMDAADRQKRSPSATNLLARQDRFADLRYASNLHLTKSGSSSLNALSGAKSNEEHDSSASIFDRNSTNTNGVGGAQVAVASASITDAGDDKIGTKPKVRSIGDRVDRCSGTDEANQFCGGSGTDGSVVGNDDSKVEREGSDSGGPRGDSGLGCGSSSLGRPRVRSSLRGSVAGRVEGEDGAGYCAQERRRSSAAQRRLSRRSRASRSSIRLSGSFSVSSEGCPGRVRTPRLAEPPEKRPLPPSSTRSSLASDALSLSVEARRSSMQSILSDDLSAPLEQQEEELSSASPVDALPPAFAGAGRTRSRVGEKKGSLKSSSSRAREVGEEISLPFKMQQNLHITYNVRTARYEGLPPGWTQLNQQFGIPLAMVPKATLQGYAERIPAVLEMMRHYLIDNGGREVVGIFRVAPDKDDCDKVKGQINSGTFEGCKDVAIIANLIKVWFRDLPEQLYSDISEKKMHAVCQAKPDDVPKLMEDVKEPVKSLICWMLDMLAEIATNESVNKMSARNLAIVMSPNLFTVKSDNPMVALTMSQKVAEYTHALLRSRLLTNHNYKDVS